ncbi:hypothetical protein KEM48_010385 [Puccinia striiformis f. sp. tritici PST-130]|nr:hypothetical protein KEM48_010385 [Puccinia striiformis f. sp. tritici PST-130]
MEQGTGSKDLSVASGGSSVTQKRQLDAEVDSIQPKKLKKCQELEILNRFKEFYVMQLLILKKMGVYVDEEDIEEFKDLIKDINESPILLEEDIRRCKLEIVFEDNLKIGLKLI